MGNEILGMIGAFLLVLGIAAGEWIITLFGVVLLVLGVTEEKKAK